MDDRRVVQELGFKAVRSSGAGGQHVNKVATKIEFSFDVDASNALSPHEKARIRRKLKHRLTNENILRLQCDETRSQHKNRELGAKRFLELLEHALQVKKKRRKTKPSRSSIEKRLKVKKKNAQKKAHRQKPSLD
ncbi:alternative ribosome rescue aminoacyl-tRNA hydrolase ArfB [Pareuzebyella sediminis]|uniref:alternative ribosome rescue aminoacyl-tRNA hydrolase ArfB n=1 Tax=Pareuzebyella sediminis TaxID=2607998 RepID=UPI0011ED8804|nr:alternative ribosome rescue aminoacyl-tRNA hydrolase ArfB [Pareuzebyella sediminis]